MVGVRSRLLRPGNGLVSAPSPRKNEHGFNVLVTQTATFFVLFSQQVDSVTGDQCICVDNIIDKIRVQHYGELKRSCVV